MKTRTKATIVAVLGFLVIVAGLAIAIPERKKQVICALEGGKLTVGFMCDHPAKDAGRNCVYDAECSKRLCIYPTISIRPYQQELSAAGGRCIEYDRFVTGEFCHRSKNGTEAEQLWYGNDGEVRCDVSVF